MGAGGLSTSVGTTLVEAKPVMSLWEQSLLAMNDDAVGLKNRVACIASKLCSHRPGSHKCFCSPQV
ncbi:hypothetical protein EMIT043CA1_50132 [Pseudomonas brassicacearum]